MGDCAPENTESFLCGPASTRVPDRSEEPIVYTGDGRRLLYHDPLVLRPANRFLSAHSSLVRKSPTCDCFLLNCRNFPPLPVFVSDNTACLRGPPLSASDITAKPDFPYVPCSGDTLVSVPLWYRADLSTAVPSPGPTAGTITSAPHPRRRSRTAEEHSVGADRCACCAHGDCD